MNRDVVLQLVWLAGSFVLVASALVARSRLIGNDRKLMGWALLWIAIFIAGAAVATNFT